jgi:transcriptional antiterminator
MQTLMNDKLKSLTDLLISIGRQKVVKMAMEMHLSERTIEREIKKIKTKILKLI